MEYSQSDSIDHEKSIFNIRLNSKGLIDAYFKNVLIFIFHISIIAKNPWHHVFIAFNKTTIPYE